MSTQSNKTKQLLTYLIDQHDISTVTSLMKLCYLSDLVNTQRQGKKISDFKYIRWHYGPYDQSIMNYLFELIEEDLIESEAQFTKDGNEYYHYKIKKKDYDTSLLNEKEISNIEAVLNTLQGYGPAGLKQVAYKTKPMKALGATEDGKENLGARLNLSA